MKTELMNRYEDETDEMSTWTWHNREFVTDDVLDWSHEKIQALEAQLTWRDAVKDPPTLSGKYLIQLDNESWFPYFLATYYADLKDWEIVRIGADGKAFVQIVTPRKWLPIPKGRR